MGTRWYGSLTNRIEEGKNYNQDNLIHVGDDITMYYYSDSTCYYVTDVINQKNIKVKRYSVCADHSKEGGQGHQNWLYFRTVKEMNDYLKTFFPERDYLENIEDAEEEWVFRYGHWNEKYIDRDGQIRFRRLQKISFGVRRYYYDWEY